MERFGINKEFCKEFSNDISKEFKIVKRGLRSLLDDDSNQYNQSNHSVTQFNQSSHLNNQSTQFFNNHSRMQFNQCIQSNHKPQNSIIKEKQTKTKKLITNLFDNNDDYDDAIREDESTIFMINNDTNKIDESSFNDELEKLNENIDIDINIKHFEPREYQLEVFNKIKDRNSVVFMETGKGKTIIAMMMIHYIFGYDYKIISGRTKNKEPLDNQKKVVFLVGEVALAQQHVITLDSSTPFKVAQFVGGKMSSKMQSFDIFRKTWEASDIFVSTPQIIYKLLSIGFLKISDINLLIIDECHHTDQNHSYNNIMREFYFYYKLQEKNDFLKNFSLPRILGLTASPLKKAIGNSKLSEKAYESLQQICQNHDAVIVLDPEVYQCEYKKGSDFIMNISNEEAERDYLDIMSHVYLPDYEQVQIAILKGLYMPLIKICFDYLEDLSLKELKSEYENFVQDGLAAPNIRVYNELLMGSYSYLYSLRNRSDLFLVLEKLRMNIFQLLENVDFASIIDLIKNSYLPIIANISVNNNKNGTNLEIPKEAAMKFTTILTTFLKKYSKSIKFESDRLIKLQEKIVEIMEDDIYEPKKQEDKHRVIIFVCNRVVSKALNENLNEFLDDNLNTYSSEKISCVHVVGVGKKKGIASVAKNSALTMNEKIKEFRDGKARILIATSAVEEGIDVKQCDTVIVYTPLRTAKQYIQMKGRARKKEAKFIIFSEDKLATQAKIDDFVHLIKYMRELFINDIVGDFKEKGFEKSFEIKYKHFFNPETHAKLTIKNVAVIFNETLQALKNKKHLFEYENEFVERRVQLGKGFFMQFKAKMKFKKCGRINKREMEGGFCDRKDVAAAECYLMFLYELYSNDYLDEHFTVK